MADTRPEITHVAHLRWQILEELNYAKDPTVTASIWRIRIRLSTLNYDPTVIHEGNNSKAQSRELKPVQEIRTAHDLKPVCNKSKPNRFCSSSQSKRRRHFDAKLVAQEGSDGVIGCHRHRPCRFPCPGQVQHRRLPVDLPTATLERVVEKKKKKKKRGRIGRRVTRIKAADSSSDFYFGYFRRASSGGLAGDASGLRCT